MTAAAIPALEQEVRFAKELFATLTPAEWETASACEGWRVQDVAQHMASVFQQIADPTSIDMGDSGKAESSAEVPVQARRDWTINQVVERLRRMVAEGSRGAHRAAGTPDGRCSGTALRPRHAPAEPARQCHRVRPLLPSALRHRRSHRSSRCAAPRRGRPGGDPRVDVGGLATDVRRGAGGRLPATGQPGVRRPRRRELRAGARRRRMDRRRGFR